MVKNLIVFGNIFHHLINNKLYNLKKCRKEIINKKHYLEKNSLKKCDHYYIQYILCKYILKILKDKENYEVFITQIKWGKNFKIQYLFDFFNNIQQSNICNDLDNKKKNYRKCIKSMKGGSLSLQKNSDFSPNNLSINNRYNNLVNNKIYFDISKLKNNFKDYEDYIFIDYGSTNSKVFLKNDKKHINIYNKSLEYIINDIISNPTKDVKKLKIFLEKNNYYPKHLLIFATAGMRNSTKENFKLVKMKFRVLSETLISIGIKTHKYIISGHLEGFLEMKVLQHKFKSKLKKYINIDLFSMGGQSIQHIILRNNKFTFEVDNTFGGFTINKYCKKILSKKNIKFRKNNNKSRKNNISFSESL